MVQNSRMLEIQDKLNLTVLLNKQKLEALRNRTIFNRTKNMKIC